MTKKELKELTGLTIARIISVVVEPSIGKKIIKFSYVNKGIKYSELRIEV